MWNMNKKISDGDEKNHNPSDGTESLIQDAFISSTKRRIALNPAFLDDEKLPESERIGVLQQIFHRNIRRKQIQRLAPHISPVLGGRLPPNILIYGPSGTGKSVTCLHFLATLSAMCPKKSTPFHYFYVDLTTPKTCFGAFNELAIALDSRTRRYRKGIALEHIQETVIAALNRLDGIVCVMIDEVDNITVDSDIFYTFLAKTLPKKASASLFYIFLTNRLEWEKTIDPRILSVLKKTDMIFEPYDAVDLVEILNLRVEKALDVNKVDSGAIRKIAGHASRETGDARKAVELLVKAVKIAEESSGYLGMEEVDRANSMLELDKTEELINALATQQRFALIACYKGLEKQKGKLTTGHAYQFYSNTCIDAGSRPLTQRRFSDMVSFLDLYGLINARVISKGRYGKTRELSASLPDRVIEQMIGFHDW
jgi:cell division control protein 6